MDTRIEPAQLRQTFDRLETRVAREPIRESSLAIESLTHEAQVLAAIDSERNWAVAWIADPSRYPHPAIQLDSLSVEYGVNYILHSEGDSTTVRVTVIRCKSAEEVIRGLFLRFISTLLSSLTEYPTENALATEIDRWIALFWRAQTPAKNSVVGLIGELTLIDESSDPTSWVRSWHVSPFDSIDFSFASPLLEVEVKSTGGPERVHVLSMHQTESVQPGIRYFASVIVELRETGSSIGGVVEEIASKLAGGEAAIHFWKCITEMCGSSYQAYMNTTYNREVSRRSLAFYAAEDVPQPKVILPLPPGVSQLRFRSDFSSASSVSPSVLFSLAKRS